MSGQGTTTYIQTYIVSIVGYGNDNMKDNKYSSEEIEKILQDRNIFELWLDKHNHLMELIRTISGLTAALMSSIVALKIFGVI